MPSKARHGQMLDLHVHDASRQLRPPDRIRLVAAGGSQTARKKPRLCIWFTSHAYSASIVRYRSPSDSTKQLLLPALAVQPRLPASSTARGRCCGGAHGPLELVIVAVVWQCILRQRQTTTTCSYAERGRHAIAQLPEDTELLNVPQMLRRSSNDALTMHRRPHLN